MRGYKASSPSFVNRNGSIDASKSSSEAQLEHDFMQLEGGVEHFAHGKNPTCLRFLPLFVAQRAIGQSSPLLQIETIRLMLPDCLWKHKWNMTSCSWSAKLGTLHMGKNYLLALFTFVHGAEGDRATSPSFASRNGSIDAAKAPLEAQMERNFMQLASKAGRFTHGKNCLLAILSFVHGVEGDEATSPCFVAENAAVDAFSSSVEALCAI